MALIKCKECGKEISNDSKSCPNCGSPPPKQTSGCAKFALFILALGTITAVFTSLGGGGENKKATESSQNKDTVTQFANDDLTVFTSRFGPPDQIKSSENEEPRPPIITKQLIYKKEHVRATYIPDAPVGSSPPFNSWKLMGFQDSRTNKVLEPDEVIDRLRGRQKK